MSNIGFTLMNWFKLAKPKRIFAPDERIESAAIYAKGKIYTGVTHAHAMLQALEDGALRRNKETGYLEPIDGGEKHFDLFITNKGQLIDRWESDEYFGITASENMTEQQLNPQGY